MHPSRISIMDNPYDVRTQRRCGYGLRLPNDVGIGQDEGYFLAVCNPELPWSLGSQSPTLRLHQFSDDLC